MITKEPGRNESLNICQVLFWGCGWLELHLVGGAGNLHS